VNTYAIKLEEVDQAESVRQRIERRFPDLLAVASANFADQQLGVQFIRSFAWALSLLAVVIGGVGMMNTMLMSVFERTREIGGWRRGRVLAMILSESLLLSLLGGLAGVVVGLVAVKALGRPARHFDPF